jgi:hypothetical protein
LALVLGAAQLVAQETYSLHPDTLDGVWQGYDGEWRTGFPISLREQPSKEPRMTVGELRKKLEGIDPQTNVVVHWEIDSEHTYFNVSDMLLRKGSPSIFEGIVGFTFAGKGAPAWLFINVEEA